MKDVDIQVVVWIEIRPDRTGEDQDQDGSHADQRQPMPDEAPNARPSARRWTSCAGGSISVDADAGIVDGIKQVRGEIADKHENGGDHEDSHHHRVIAVANGIEEQPSHPGPGENGFGHQRAPEQRR